MRELALAFNGLLACLSGFRAGARSYLTQEVLHFIMHVLVQW